MTPTSPTLNGRERGMGKNTPEELAGAPGSVRKKGGPSPSWEIAQMLYRRTPLDEWGNRRLYEEVLETMAVEWVKVRTTPQGWRIYWEKRVTKDGPSYVIVRKLPLPAYHPGNVWEETLLFEGGKILPDSAYEEVSG